ncbi:MAG: hypothetical protein IPK75_18960 [Acidobacteria bacterium]|nr:hypothetical protein [Acidobacteriota bacterium]
MAVAPTTKVDAAEPTSPTGKKTFLSVPKPPRYTGDPTTDAKSSNDWAWELYRALELSNVYLKTTAQYDAAVFDAAKLPDPARTTLYQAQNTANNAYVLATRLAGDMVGELMIEGAASRAATFTFETAQPDDEYAILATPISYVSGGAGLPPPEATLIIAVTKAVDSFTLTTNKEPGLDSSVTFQWVLVRR